MAHPGHSLVVAPEDVVRRGAITILLSAAIAAMAVATVEAHDLFLRPRDYIVHPDGVVNVRVLNGTFVTSESPVTPDRLSDLSVVGPSGRVRPDRSRWSATGNASGWSVDVGEAGTYVLGASLLPRTIRLTDNQFSDYLREEGLPDMIAARRVAGTAHQPAHERYSKHVKALVRVEGGGNAAPAEQDTAYRSVLGYPAEVVPLSDPYRLRGGGTLEVQALVDGGPAVRQVILSGGRTPDGKPIAERQVRTDARGRARVVLSRRGTWYVKFIHMVAVPSSAGDSVTHESKWATLTFAVR